MNPNFSRDSGKAEQERLLGWVPFSLARLRQYKNVSRTLSLQSADTSQPILSNRKPGVAPPRDSRWKQRANVSHSGTSRVLTTTGRERICDPSGLEERCRRGKGRKEEKKRKAHLSHPWPTEPTATGDSQQQQSRIEKQDEGDQRIRISNCISTREGRTRRRKS